MMDPSEGKPTAGEESKSHSHTHSLLKKHRHHKKKPEASDKSFAELIPDTYETPSSTKKVKGGSKTFAQYVPDDVPPTAGKRLQDPSSKDSKPYAKLLQPDEAPARRVKSRSGVDAGEDKPVEKKGHRKTNVSTERMFAVASRPPRDPQPKDEYTNEKLDEIPSAAAQPYAKQPRDAKKPPVSVIPVDVEHDLHMGSSLATSAATSTAEVAVDGSLAPRPRRRATTPEVTPGAEAVDGSLAPRPRRRAAAPEVTPGAVAVAGFDARIGDDDDDTYIIGDDTEEALPEALDPHVVGRDGYSDHHDILEQIEQLEEMDEGVIEAQVVPEEGDKPFFSRKSSRAGAACLVVTVVVAIVVGVVVGGRDGPIPPVSPMPSFAPSSSPSLAPTSVEFSDLFNFVASMSLDNGTALSDPSSPQYEALRWLSNNANLDEYSNVQRIQRYVLAVVYYSTNGDGWQQSNGWLTDEDECSWFVKSTTLFCGPDLTTKRVSVLDLSENNLLGTMPGLELALLSDSLAALHLNGNELSGTLPSELGLLTKLSSYIEYGLQLSNNRLEGTIPTTFGNCTSLGLLNLEDNLLTGTMPSEIGLLTVLTSLQLANNNLTDTIPLEFFFLTNLLDLGLYNNELTGVIPTDIALLSNLSNLELSVNTFEGIIPSELGLLLQLETLRLNDNMLTSTIPGELPQLPLLTNLYLYNNLLSGSFTCPSAIEDCRVSCGSVSDACRTL